MTIGVTMNFCLILIQSSELVLCTSSTILIMPCNELMSRTCGMFEHCGLRTC
jgi:hypothetical protein